MYTACLSQVAGLDSKVFYTCVYGIVYMVVKYKCVHSMSVSGCWFRFQSVLHMCIWYSLYGGKIQVRTQHVCIRLLV